MESDRSIWGTTTSHSRGDRWGLQAEVCTYPGYCSVAGLRKGGGGLSAFLTTEGGDPPQSRLEVGRGFPDDAKRRRATWGAGEQVSERSAIGYRGVGFI
jgi:hypothetical protein